MFNDVIEGLVRSSALMEALQDVIKVFGAKQIGVIIPYNNNQAFDQLLQGALNQSIKQG